MSDKQISPVAGGEDIAAILLDQFERLLQRHVTKEILDRAERENLSAGLWSEIASAGLPLALVPEANGGYELPAPAAMGLIRRAAYHNAPVPIGETMIASALWASAGGDAVDGALSMAPSRAQDRVAIRRASGGYQLDGRMERVPWGDGTDHILILAHDEAGAVWLSVIQPSTVVHDSVRNLAGEPRPTLRLESLTVADSSVRPAPQACRGGLMIFGALLRAQQMVGAMERCLDQALAFADERKQFGRSIGKFQAVQHMLAEASGHYAAAAAAADTAASAWETEGLAWAAALAKARAGEAAGKVAAICHQVLGAMGFTREHPLHFSTRRLWSWRDEFGSEPHWQEWIGRKICERGGLALWDTLLDITRARPGAQRTSNEEQA